MRTTRNLWPLLIILTVLGGCKPGDDGQDSSESSSIDTEDRIRTTGEPPTFRFPDAAACKDPNVNEFVKRFVKTCLSGNYAGYREMVTRLVEPIGHDAFETAWHAVKRVEVRSIVLADNVQRYPAPVYLVGAEVEMREPEASDAHVITGPRVRNVSILVFREPDEWVMAPAPRQIRERYAQSQPAAEAP